MFDIVEKIKQQNKHDYSNNELVLICLHIQYKEHNTLNY